MSPQGAPKPEPEAEPEGEKYGGEKPAAGQRPSEKMEARSLMARGRASGSAQAAVPSGAPLVCSCGLCWAPLAVHASRRGGAPTGRRGEAISAALLRVDAIRAVVLRVDAIRADAVEGEAIRAALLRAGVHRRTRRAGVPGRGVLG